MREWNENENTTETKKKNTRMEKRDAKWKKKINMEAKKRDAKEMRE